MTDWKPPYYFDTPESNAAQATGGIVLSNGTMCVLAAYSDNHFVVSNGHTRVYSLIFIPKSGHYELDSTTLLFDYVVSSVTGNPASGWDYTPQPVSVTPSGLVLCAGSSTVYIGDGTTSYGDLPMVLEADGKSVHGLAAWESALFFGFDGVTAVGDRIIGQRLVQAENTDGGIGAAYNYRDVFYDLGTVTTPVWSVAASYTMPDVVFNGSLIPTYYDTVFLSGNIAHAFLHRWVDGATKANRVVAVSSSGVVTPVSYDGSAPSHWGGGDVLPADNTKSADFLVAAREQSPPLYETYDRLIQVTNTGAETVLINQHSAAIVPETSFRAIRDAVVSIEAGFAFWESATGTSDTSIDSTATDLGEFGAYHSWGLGAIGALLFGVGGPSFGFPGNWMLWVRLSGSEAPLRLFGRDDAQGLVKSARVSASADVHNNPGSIQENPSARLRQGGNVYL